MAIAKAFRDDVEAILSRRHDNGDDFWATPDGRWGKGGPFSTFDCVLMLHELGMKRTDPVLKGAADRIFGAWLDDGRFRYAPRGPVYPCYTTNAARALCRLGYARDRRIKKTFEHLLEDQHDDGGWRCAKRKLGLSPVTDASNPGVTLAALDAFRFSNELLRDRRLRAAVQSLLDHWDVRRPMGPCSFGIGSRFMQVEYPFLRYNLFYYVYVLSHYDAAKKDRRFRKALAALQSKLYGDRIVVENPNRKLAGLALCRKGEPNRLATKRYRELLENLG